MREMREMREMRDTRVSLAETYRVVDLVPFEPPLPLEPLVLALLLLLCISHPLPSVHALVLLHGLLWRPVQRGLPAFLPTVSVLHASLLLLAVSLLLAPSLSALAVLPPALALHPRFFPLRLQFCYSRPATHLASFEAWPFSESIRFL